MPPNRSDGADDFDPDRFPIDKKKWKIIVYRLKLAPEQTRIVERLLCNRQNKQIAADLGKSESTVCTQLKRIYRNTNTDGRCGLIIRIFGMAMDIANEN